MPSQREMSHEEVLLLIEEVDQRENYMGLFHGIITILRLTLERINDMATSTAAGLLALQQAQTDLANEIQSNTQATTAALSEIQSLLNQLKQAPDTTEDSTVQSIAAQIEQQITAIHQNTLGLTAAVPVPTAAGTVSGTPNGTDVHGTPLPVTASPSNPVPPSDPVVGTTGNDNPVPNTPVDSTTGVAPVVPAVNSAGGVS